MPLASQISRGIAHAIDEIAPGYNLSSQIL